MTTDTKGDLKENTLIYVKWTDEAKTSLEVHCKGTTLGISRTLAKLLFRGDPVHPDTKEVSRQVRMCLAEAELADDNRKALEADFEEFLREQERLNHPREQVRRLVIDYCRRTGKSYSLAWRTLYLKLEAQTGYRVPEDPKSRLRAVEAAGRLDELLQAAKSLA
ncbi:MAG: hypothetical protein FJ271_27580 [Planctomycetes bacterium]|nr:hypothetical protein [Planctomycetota bacterium]